MDYRKTYNDLKKQVTEEITAIAKQYDEMHTMGMDGMTIFRDGVLDDYELVEMWYSEDYNDVVFTSNDDDELLFLDNYDLDTRIDILTFLKGNSMMAGQAEHKYECYQVFREDADHMLLVETIEGRDEAVRVYNEEDGFLLLGIDAPTCFDVIYAKPYGMASIS